MFSLSNRRLYLVGMFVVVLVAWSAWLAVDRFIPAPPAKITMAAGAKGGAFEYFANRYREVLARSHVTLEIRTTEGTGENLKLLQDAKSGVEAAFVQGGVSNTGQAPDLELLGRVNYLSSSSSTGPVRS